jgi:hypothetical protein
MGAIFRIFADSDQSGSIAVQGSVDALDWRPLQAATALTGGTPQNITVSIATRYVRVVYTNGGTAQTRFVLSTAVTD